MSEPFVPCVGGVFSADIAIPEHEREVRFYSRVLSTGERPLWRDEDLMNNLGLPILGLGARSPEHVDLPIQWMPHIQVADASATGAPSPMVPHPPPASAALQLLPGPQPPPPSPTLRQLARPDAAPSLALPSMEGV